MLQLQAMLAIDIANERAREAASLAEGRRVADLMAEEVAEHGLVATRPGLARRAIAGLLYRIEGGASGIARAACEAAARLDGSTA